MMCKKLKLDGLRKKYLIYEDGRIFDVENNRFKKQYENKKGYMFTSFYINGKSKKFFIHRLVLMMFNPVKNMENLQVDHIDTNKKNNRLDNLEWVTQSENQRRAFKNGLISRSGIKNSQCKLNEKEVIEIANMLVDNIPYKIIIEKYNVSKSLLSSIRNKRLWRDLLKDYIFPKSKYSNQK